MTPMDEDDSIDEISKIEARIEELAEVSERCRKIILASKAAIAGGAVLLAATILGLLGSNQVVALGSNVSTLRQTEAAIGDAEMLRSSLINEIAPREVRDSPLKLV